MAVFQQEFSHFHERKTYSPKIINKDFCPLVELLTEGSDGWLIYFVPCADLFSGRVETRLQELGGNLGKERKERNKEK